MNRQIFSIIIAVAICAAAFTSCNMAVDELKMTTAEVQTKAVITALSTRSELSDFVAELKAMDVTDIEAEELTVFAVTNCNSTDRTECEAVIVKRHIVSGKYGRQELTDSLQLTSLDGTVLLVTVKDANIYVNGMKLGNEILVGKSIVYIVDGAIPAAPVTPENPHVSVTGLLLNQPVLSLEVGKTEYIAMLIQPYNATNQKVTWQCNKSEVVEVAAFNGIDSLFSVTAIAAGTANITFTTIEGGYTAICTVTVTEKNDLDDGGNDDDNGQSTCDYDVIISQTEFESRATPRSALTITDMKITDNCLKIKFNASGCDGNTWAVKLIDSEIVDVIDWTLIADSLPPPYNHQRSLLLSLDNKEECKALINKEVSFNIEDLQVQGTNKIQLRFLFGSEKGILYEY